MDSQQVDAKIAQALGSLEGFARAIEEIRLLDKFAEAAMTGILAYEMAVAMLAEREKVLTAARQLDSKTAIQAE